MKFTVIYQSNYNGVNIIADDKEASPEIKKLLYKMDDEASNTLPDYTHECASDEWDHSLALSSRSGRASSVLG